MSHRHAHHALALLLLSGCLGPAVSDQPGYSTSLLDKDAKVARVDDNKPLAMRIDAADGIDGPVVALRAGFLDRQAVHYWEFGSALNSAEPVWQFRRRGAHGADEEIGHFDLVDSAPGDAVYSPFRQIYTVFVTDTYAGERITSLQALDDAIETGIVDEPKRSKTYVNWPMALAGVQLDQGQDQPMLSPRSIYYRGKIASYFDPAGSADDAGRFSFEKEPIPTPNAYVLHRQNEVKPLDEGAMHTDLDSDGDSVDSNLIFQLGSGEPGYSSIWRQVDVTVAADYVFGSSQSEADLFERDMAGLRARSQVIEYQESMLLLNRVLQRSAQ